MIDALAVAHGDDASAVDTAQKPAKTYKCRSCTKVFKRNEHCSRHELVHTQERPFSCRFCHKRYARKDLVKRHEATLHAESTRRQSNTVPTAQIHAQPNSTNPPETLPQQPEVTYDSDQDDVRSTIVVSQRVDEASRPSLRKKRKSGAGSPRVQDSLRTAPSTRGGNNDQNETTVGPECLPNLQKELGNTMGHGSEATPQHFETSKSYYSTMFGKDSMGHDPDTSAPESAMSMLVSSALGPPVFERAINASNDVQRDLAAELPNSPDAGSGVDIPASFQPFDFTLDGDLSISQSAVESMDILQSLNFLPDNPFELRDDFTFLTADGNFEQSPSDSTSSNFASRNFDNLPPAPSAVNHRARQSETTTGLDAQHTHSQTLFERLPTVLRERSTNPARLELDNLSYQNLIADSTARFGPGKDAPKLPTCNQLSKYLTSYIDCFHRHLPIIHLHSLSLQHTPSPLIFAMACIGALYRLDRPRAANLFLLAETSLSKTSADASDFGFPGPLWAAQARTIISYYAIFHGDQETISRCLGALSAFVPEYRVRRAELANKAKSASSMTWSEWILRESSKRLLCALFITHNLLLITYTVNPGVNVADDLDFETPDEERLWSAPSADQWRDLQQSRIVPRKVSLRTAMLDVFTDSKHVDSQQTSYQVTGFTALVITHALNIHMWHITQYTQSCNLTLGCMTNESLRSSLLSNASSAVARCQEAILRGKPIDHEASWDDPEGPLMFNCQALLRIAFSRLFMNTGAFDRLVLLADDEQRIDAAVKSYVEASEARGSFVDKAVAKAYEGFLTPIKIGHLHVRKTAALSWSVEHAVAGWDSALFVTKWVHTIEMSASHIRPSAQESHILDQLKALLEEVESKYKGTTSLAAAVTRTWASFLNDVWVWGITPRMGATLERLADAYEDSFRLRQSRGTNLGLV